MLNTRAGLALVAVFAASLFTAGSALAGPPNYNAAEAVCAAAGGDMFDDFGDLGYGCRSVPTLTDGQFFSGRAVCEHAYGGTFIVRPSGYVCSRG
jgi:hypothetical protein